MATVNHGTKNCKLTDEEALKVIALYRAGWKQRRLAEAFGVSQGTVSGIVKGRTYAHLDPLRRGEVPPPQLPVGPIRVDESVVREVRRLAAEGVAKTEIVRRTGLARSYVYDLLAGKSRREVPMPPPRRMVRMEVAWEAGPWDRKRARSEIAFACAHNGAQVALSEEWGLRGSRFLGAVIGPQEAVDGVLEATAERVVGWKWVE